MGMPDVFEDTIVPFPRTASTRSSSARLIAGCSMTASTIQIDGREAGEISIESTHPYQGRGLGRKERIRFQATGPLQALFRHVSGEIQEQRRGSCVGKVRGDLRTHHPGAQNGCGSNWRQEH